MKVIERPLLLESVNSRSRVDQRFARGMALPLGPFHPARFHLENDEEYAYTAYLELEVI